MFRIFHLTSVPAVSVATVLVLVACASGASADSGGATIHAIPSSEEVQVEAVVHHQCSSENEPCDWFAEGSAESAGDGCPVSYDASHGVWVGGLQEYGGPTFGAFAFLPYELGRYILVCLYVNDEGSDLVGNSHVFDIAAGRELIPPPKPPPPPKPSHCSGLRTAQRRLFAITIIRTSCATARKLLTGWEKREGLAPYHGWRFTLVNPGRLLESNEALHWRATRGSQTISFRETHVVSSRP